MLVLIDANIVLDILEKREPFYESSNDVLSLCASKKIKGCIALHSVSIVKAEPQGKTESKRILVLQKPLRFRQ